jgi:hypothetical protein
VFEWLSRLSPARWFADWSYTELVIFSVSAFVVTFVGSLVAVGWVVVRLPAGFFANDECRTVFRACHPVLRVVLVVLKNLLGMLLVLLGVALSMPGMPGQGLLTILIGSLLLDYPGKRSVERWILSRRGVLAKVNKLRARYGKEPMYLDCPTPLEGEPPSSTTTAEPVPDSYGEPTCPRSAAGPTCSATTSIPTRSSRPST